MSPAPSGQRAQPPTHLSASGQRPPGTLLLPPAHRAPGFPWPRLLWRGADHSTCRLPRPARRPRNTGLPGTPSSEPGGLPQPWGAPMASASAAKPWLLSRPHTAVRSRLQTGFQPTSAPGRSQGSRAQTHPGARLPPRTLTLHGSPQPDPRLLRERPVLTSLRPRSRGSQDASVPDCLQSNIRPHVPDLPTAWPALVAPVAPDIFQQPKNQAAAWPCIQSAGSRCRFTQSPGTWWVLEDPGCRTTCSIALKVGYSQIQTVLIL